MGMRELAIAYFGIVVALLVLSTSIEDEDVRLSHVLIAALGWPLIVPVMAWKGRTRR